MPNREQTTRTGSAMRSWVVACMLSLCMASVSEAPAQTSEATYPAPQADAAELGFDFPEGGRAAAADRRVLAPSFEGTGAEPVVAKVLIEAGDRLAVVMPDGWIMSFAERDCTPTDRPFTPVDKADLAKRLTSEKFRGFKTRQTRRYLYVYNTSEAFFQATSRILETMYPNLHNFWRRQKVAVHDPETPLVVIMFRTQDEFRQYRDMGEGVVAYYNVVSNQVLMYEESALSRVAPEIALKQSISTIAHEGVHQVLGNIGVQARLSNWPAWICEGLAEYFAPTSADRGVRWKGIGLVNDLRMRDIVAMRKEPSFRAGSGDIIRHLVSGEQFTANDYALAWGLTHYLAERRVEAFHEYLRDVSQLSVDDAADGAASLAMFTARFGDDLAGLERDMFAHLQSLDYVDPVDNHTHYVAMLEVDTPAGTSRQTLIVLSQEAARKWQRDNAQPTARTAIQAFPNRKAAELFAAAWLNRR